MNRKTEADTNETVCLIDLIIFSCEAQLNTCTCALSVCLSVCLSVSKLNFSLFGQLMTAYDNI